MRRVVTGDNAQGQSVIIIDGGPSSEVGNPDLGGLSRSGRMQPSALWRRATAKNIGSATTSQVLWTAIRSSWSDRQDRLRQPAGSMLRISPRSLEAELEAMLNHRRLGRRHLVVRAALDQTPYWLRTILGLNGYGLRAWELALVRRRESWRIDSSSKPTLPSRLVAACGCRSIICMP